MAQRGLVHGDKPGCAGGDGLKRGHHHLLTKRQPGKGMVPLQKEERPAAAKEYCQRKDRHDFGMQPPASEIPAMGQEIVPDQKAQAAADNQDHNHEIHQRLPRQRAKGIPPAQEIETRVAVGGHGMEHRHP